MPYPSTALREYVLRSELAPLVSGGGTGPTGATGAPGAPWTPVQSATAPAIASSDTVTTAAVTVARVAPTTNVTGVILAAGTITGQQVVVLNESGYTIAFAAAATSLVATGTSCVIAGQTHLQFIWNSVTTYWYPATTSVGTGGTGTGTYGGGATPTDITGTVGLTIRKPSMTGSGSNGTGRTYGAATYGDGTYG